MFFDIPPLPVPSETSPRGHVALLVKAHTKLVNSAYPYQTAGYRNGDVWDTDMRLVLAV